MRRVKEHGNIQGMPCSGAGSTHGVTRTEDWHDVSRVSRGGFRGDMGRHGIGRDGRKGREEWLQSGVYRSTADQLSAARVGRDCGRDCCCRVVPDACRALQGGWVGARLPTLTESGGLLRHRGG
jgi:hypothetical protein